MRRCFGQAEVLSGIDLSLGADEMLVVLGPTGAGKTTLLRIVAGLDAPDAGRVEMGGHEVTHWPPADRDVALVFQHFALYPDWSVRRNLEFPLKAPRRSLSSDELDRRVGWAAELLQTERLLDRPAGRLSGGEMQRVAIGQAIVRRPRLFLFDEPLTNLDAKLRESLRLELALLRQELGIPAMPGGGCRAWCAWWWTLGPSGFYRWIGPGRPSTSPRLRSGVLPRARPCIRALTRSGRCSGRGRLDVR